MQLVWFNLALAGVVSTGLMAGALLAEACILVPFWRGLEPEVFLTYYRSQARALLRFFGPLEIACCVLVALAGGAAVLRSSGGSLQWILAGVSLLAILGSFPLYFRGVNARFAAGTIALHQVADELRRWARWHWLRTGLALAAFVLAVVATWQNVP